MTVPHRPSSGRSAAVLGAAVILCAACLLLRPQAAWLTVYPTAWLLDIAGVINAALGLVLETGAPVFRMITAVLEALMVRLRDLLHAVPWTVLTFLIAAFGFRASGWKLAALSTLTCVYIFSSGYWEESLNSLALVLIALPLAAGGGLGLGIWMHRSPRAATALSRLLDIMQTVPAFAYLVPMIVLFGLGAVVGLIASIIYAVPPMARNTKLALDSVPSDLHEVSAIAGCSARQRFLLVEVPTALPQILVGLNQTVMAVLSMVVFAAIIGGFQDIGWEVLRSMRRAQFGQSVISGIIITLIAILLDRITSGFATKARRHSSTDRSARRSWLMIAVIAALVWGASALVPAIPQEHSGQGREIAEQINRLLNDFSISIGAVTDAIKANATYFFLLPIRAGLENAVSPYTWGIAFTPAFKAGFWVLLLTAAAVLARMVSAVSGVLVIASGCFLYAGTMGVPWPGAVAIFAAIGYWIGGWRLAALWSATLLGILVTGLWLPAMFSLYLCLAALVICVLLGGVIGVAAAESSPVSAMVRPVVDLLQTIPPFVFLIPVVMLFQVGDFSALLAIVAYAIAPIIRYTESGLRQVAAEQVEAGRSIGCSRWQLLWLIKLPVAMPQIALGVNQSIMYSLAMLSVAALVGSRDLGQEVYVALGKADAGLGLLAGFAIAMLAISVDRTIHTALTNRSETTV